MAIIGLSNLHYALVTADTATATTYSAVKKISKIISADVKAASNFATLFADNGPSDVGSALGEISVDFEVADLPLEVVCDLLGHKLVNGIMVSNINDQAPYVAIMFEGLKPGGQTKYVKLLKGMFGEADDSFKTKEDKVTFQTTKISGKFVQRTFDSNWKYTADTESATYLPAIGTAWYTSVDPVVTG